MSTFEKHGVSYLSPSTINLFISQPALCLLKIAGITDGGAGPAAWRGQGVDRVASMAAMNPDVSHEVLEQLAIDTFDHYMGEALDEFPQEKIQAEKKQMLEMTNIASGFYKTLGEKPIGEQGKVLVQLDDIDVPWVGYYDLLYEDKVRDTKSVGRMPSEVASSASRQAALYAHATGKEPWIDYIGKKEARSYRVDNVPFWIRQLRLAALSLQRILNHSDDIFECCKMVYPDLDGQYKWMWGDTTRQAAIDIWNMEGMNS